MCVRSSVDRRLDSSHFLSLMNDAAVNIHKFLRGPVFVFLGCTPRSGIAGSCGHSTWTLLRTRLTFPPARAPMILKKHLRTVPATSPCCGAASEPESPRDGLERDGPGGRESRAARERQGPRGGCELGSSPSLFPPNPRLAACLLLDFLNCGISSSSACCWVCFCRSGSIFVHSKKTHQEPHFYICEHRRVMRLLVKRSCCRGLWGWPAVTSRPWGSSSWHVVNLAGRRAFELGQQPHLRAAQRRSLSPRYPPGLGPWGLFTQRGEASERWRCSLRCLSLWSLGAHTSSGLASLAFPALSSPGDGGRGHRAAGPPGRSRSCGCGLHLLVPPAASPSCLGEE